MQPEYVIARTLARIPDWAAMPRGMPGELPAAAYLTKIPSRFAIAAVAVHSGDDVSLLGNMIWSADEFLRFCNRYRVPLKGKLRDRSRCVCMLAAVELAYPARRGDGPSWWNGAKRATLLEIPASSWYGKWADVYRMAYSLGHLWSDEGRHLIWRRQAA